MADEPRGQEAEWFKPPVEQEGLQRYVETIRERAWVIALVTLVSAAAAVAYVINAPKTYKAEADLLVTPVSRDNTLLTSLGLIAESSDPTRDVETAARLVTTSDVARRAKEILRSTRSAQALLDSVAADPIAQSNLVGITGTEDSPRGAADLANAFGEGTVADRTEALHRQVEAAIAGLKRQLRGNPGQTALEEQLAQLQLLRDAPDPTVRLETRADPPTKQASPRPVLSIAGALLAGLVLGTVCAFGLQALDPRLRREQQLRRGYRLPILARVPKERGRKTRRKPIAPMKVSAPTAEAYRMLRTTLTSTPDRPSSILVTGSSASEGKTTTALNLASSLALAGSRVILIEADLRRPSLSKALGISAEHGVVSVLIENERLEDALVQPETHGGNLSVLVADYEGGWIADLFAIPAARQLIEDAKRMADYVVIDSPPLNEVVDALPLARDADEVIIVARLGHSRLDRIRELAELLAETGVRPVGFVVVGAPRPGRNRYQGYRAGGGQLVGTRTGD